jgi:hypothetical protein
VPASNPVHSGACLCGGVRYTIRGALRDVIACHCTQCRKTSGHYAAMTSAPIANVAFDRAASLTWYKSSDTAERGFCRVCGSNLFWKLFADDQISICAGTLDLPTGITISEHIFVGHKSDYYALTDGLPQKAQWT